MASDPSENTKNLSIGGWISSVFIHNYSGLIHSNKIPEQLIVFIDFIETNIRFFHFFQ